MARPRRTIQVELADPPTFDAEFADGTLAANQKWVRATEILLLAQARLAARQQEAHAVEMVGQAEPLSINTTPATAGFTSERTNHDRDDGPQRARRAA